MVTESSHNTPQRQRASTSADVAKRAGVSRATVSYILNNTQGVRFTDATREAVERAAKELNYTPNAAARSLAVGAGILVLVMTHLPHNEVTSTAVEAMSIEFASRGILTTVLQETADAETFVKTIATFRPRAAVFLVEPAEAVRSGLRQAGVPMIVLPTEPENGDLVGVGTLMVHYLQGKGHTRLAFADIDRGGNFGILPRRQNVENACEAAGLIPPQVAIIARDGVGAAETIQSWHDAGVTAICAYNDEIAFAVLYGIRQAGLRCPEDVAVIGCDNLTAGAVSFPPLTSVGFELTSGVTWFVYSILQSLNLPAEAPQEGPDIMRITVRESA